MEVVNAALLEIIEPRAYLLLGQLLLEYLVIIIVGIKAEQLRARHPHRRNARILRILGAVFRLHALAHDVVEFAIAVFGGLHTLRALPAYDQEQQYKSFFLIIQYQHHQRIYNELSFLYHILWSAAPDIIPHSIIIPHYITIKHPNVQTF